MDAGRSSTRRICPAIRLSRHCRRTTRRTTRAGRRSAISKQSIDDVGSVDQARKEGFMTNEGATLPTTNAEWLEWHKQYRLQTRYTSPIVLERGEGLKLWDVDGKEYLDFHSGQVCAGIGHANPRLAEAVGAQLNRLVQTGSIFTVPGEVLVAKKLAELTPPEFGKSVFACSGAEAVEISLRMAKRATEKFELITVLGAYHGLTGGAY